LGTAQICIWADEDDDNEFDQAGNPEDGGECNEPVSPDDSDQTDVVEKTWSAGGNPTTLDAEPEVDNNDTQTSHQITATVFDEFGDPVPAGTAVDFTIRGGSRNAAQGTVCPDVATNSSGVANCTYTDTGDDATQGDDLIDVVVDGSGDSDATRAEDDDDLADTVFKRWTPGGPPATAEVLLDVEDGDADTSTTGCPMGGDYDQTATANLVGETHEVCATAEDTTNAGIAGKSITFSTDVGFFTNEDGDNLGTSVTVNADEDGDAHVLLNSEDAGTSTVTATSDSQSDTGTKQWDPAPARNIECDPDTASNPPGTSHLVTCTVTDRFGNGVEDIEVDFSEEGAGRFESEEGETDENGEVEAVTTTTEEEEGAQTITAEIGENTPGDSTTPGGTDDECEQPEGTPAGAPAGNCEDSVSKTWEVAPPPPDCAGDPNAIVGTDGDDSLVGTAGDDTICGFGGDDSIDGLGGNDTIFGGGGNDTIDGGGGADTIRGGRGADVISGGSGRDRINGGGGADRLSGGSGGDRLNGGGGADRLSGGGGGDRLNGGGGNDRLKGGGGGDRLSGGGGNDRLNGGSGGDRLNGGSGRDRLRGKGGRDRLKGQGGRDNLNGGPKRDIVNGGPGNDKCTGRRGDVVTNCERP
ncbi:MAG: Ig-like domain-containing protein, partial [Actinomycetota bacterium]